MTLPSSSPWWTTAADLAHSAEAAAAPAPALAVGAWTAASLVFLVSGIRLTVIDLREHRLPRAVIRPARLWTAGLLGLAALLGAAPERAVQALLGSAGLWLFYAILRWASRRSLGGGDVNYASLTGLIAGFTGGGTVLASVVWTFGSAALVSVWLLATRKAGPQTHIALGPSMVAGTVAALIVPLP